MRAWAWVAAVSAMTVGAGCTSVHMVQREGCWIRETEKFPKQVTEEVGPCARPEPKWADDRITRLVQECVAHEDYRWQTRAVQAWMKNQPIPEQKAENEVLQGCVNEASATMVSENEALKTRINELADDRAQYKKIAEEDRQYFKEHNDKIATALGEAAKKPAPAAVATATSNGTATTTSSQTSHPASATAHAAGPNPALTMAPDATREIEAEVVDRAALPDDGSAPGVGKSATVTQTAPTARGCDRNAQKGIGGSGPAPTTAVPAPAVTATPDPATVVQPIPPAPLKK